MEHTKDLIAAVIVRQSRCDFASILYVFVEKIRK